MQARIIASVESGVNEKFKMLNMQLYKFCSNRDQQLACISVPSPDDGAENALLMKVLLTVNLHKN